MGEIVDHQRDGSEVTKENGFTRKHSNIPKKTTNGQEVLIEWNYKATVWVGIKDVREEIPINLAEYAVSNQIDGDP